MGLASRCEMVVWISALDELGTGPTGPRSLPCHRSSVRPLVNRPTGLDDGEPGRPVFKLFMYAGTLRDSWLELRRSRGSAPMVTPPILSAKPDGPA